MNRFARTALLSAAMVATVAAPLSSANAGHRGHGNRHPVIVDHRPDNGDLIAAGILGIAIGAIIIGAAQDGGPVIEPRPRPHWDRFPDRPDAPQVITYDETADFAVEPWSREWFEACDARYRSFDPRTGTFVTRTGQRRFCTLD